MLFRSVLRGGDHAGRGGGDGGIVIQNAQQQRFQQRAFAERAFDLQDRRVREGISPYLRNAEL